MKITETSGNGINGIRGQRISIYAEVNEKKYLIDRFSVSSKYGAIKYCNQFKAGKYGKRYFDSIETAELVELKKVVNNFDEVDSRNRIK